MKGGNFREQQIAFTLRQAEEKTSGLRKTVPGADGLQLSELYVPYPWC